MAEPNLAGPGCSSRLAPRPFPDLLNLGVIDALSAHVAILDSAGVIRAVNAHWREFACANGGSEEACGVGADYLGVCRRAAGVASPAAAEVLAALEELLAGDRESFETLYPCHSPTVPRWFVIRLARFHVHGEPYILVQHEIATGGTWSRETFEKLSLIASKTSNGVILTEADGRIEWVNEAFVRLTGFTVEEVAGRRVVGLLQELGADGPALHSISSAVADGASGTARLLNHSRNGSPYWVDLTIDPAHDADGVARHFIIVQTDITERRRLEQEVADAAHREQERIARDLHDGLGQDLTGARLILLAALSRLESDNPVAELLRQAEGAVHRTLSGVRTLAYGMAPVQLSRGLVSALTALAAQMSIPGATRVHFAGGPGIDLPDMMAEQFYRIAQEAVTNAVRHSQATKILLTLEHGPYGLRLRVADDGTGFDVEDQAFSVGIRTMRYRADFIRGELTVESGRAAGTVVTCTAPI